MPAIAIALGTTAATTISTLRERQLAVRSQLNNELCDIELLRAALNSLQDADFLVSACPDLPSATATSLLRDYVARLIVESRPGTTARQVETFRVAENELVRLSALLYLIDDRSKRGESIAASAHSLIAAMASHRSNRIAEHAATYPIVHYAVLAFCSLSIIASFLLESDQELLRFLDAIQLRILFAILVGVYASIATLIVDLTDLNRGGFCITPTYMQLFIAHDKLEYDLCQRRGGAPPFILSDLQQYPSVPPRSISNNTAGFTATASSLSSPPSL